MHHYVNRGTFGGASDRPKSRSSDGKQKGRFESSSQLLDQGTAIGERFLKAAVRLAEISIPVIALEKSFHARRLLLCRDSGQPPMAGSGWIKSAIFRYQPLAALLLQRLIRCQE